MSRFPESQRRTFSMEEHETSHGQGGREGPDGGAEFTGGRLDSPRWSASEAHVIEAARAMLPSGLWRATAL